MWDAHGELRAIGLAQTDGPRRVQMPHDHRVVLRNIIVQDAGSAGGENACRIDQVLESNGHTVQRTTVMSGPQFLLGQGRLP